MTRSAKDVASDVTPTILHNAAGDQPVTSTISANLASALSKILVDPRWEKVTRWLRFATIGDDRVGACLATWSPNFGTFALNKPDMDRLLDGKVDGKVDVAVVVFVRISGPTQSVRGFAEAGELYRKLIESGLPLRDGYAGEFWALQPDFVAQYLVADTSPF